MVISLRFGFALKVCGMMQKVWRLCKARYAVSAFSGEGARLNSGRWNPAGVPMVYTSPSISLASLEYFVNLDPSVIPDDLVCICATMPVDFARERLEKETLPLDWRSVDHPGLQKMGADWVASMRSAALEVPSAVVDGEWNVLLNPAHPDSMKIKLGLPTPFQFDERMFKKV